MPVLLECVTCAMREYTANLVWFMVTNSSFRIIITRRDYRHGTRMGMCFSDKCMKVSPHIEFWVEKLDHFEDFYLAHSGPYTARHIKLLNIETLMLASKKCIHVSIVRIIMIVWICCVSFKTADVCWVRDTSICMRSLYCWTIDDKGNFSNEGPELA